VTAMTERTWARDARTIPHAPALPRTFTHCGGVPWTDQDDWGTYDGVFAMAAPPVRANAPLAGERGYEPGSDPEQAERRANRIGWACIALGVVAFWLVLGAVAWLRWRAGVTW
jgi:hypothetical protein